MANPDAGTSTVGIVTSGAEKVADGGTVVINISAGGVFPDAGTAVISIATSGGQNPDFQTTVIGIVTSGDGGVLAPTQAFDATLQRDCIDQGDPRALRMMDNLPPYLTEDPTIRAYICSCAKELNRIEAAAVAMRTGSFPDQADLRTLVYYEGLFGLSNTALTLDQRRADVVAHMRKRRVASRYDWQAALQSFIGLGWTYAEQLPYNVLLTTPIDPTGARTPIITSFARAITPAHLQLIVNGSYGNFKVGISQIGIDPL